MMLDHIGMSCIHFYKLRLLVLHGVTFGPKFVLIISLSKYRPYIIYCTDKLISKMLFLNFVLLKNLLGIIII